MIRLSGFNARAQQEVAQAVKNLTKQGATEFTLDVRDNRGGLYQQGAEVAKLFLEGDTNAVCGRGTLCNICVLHGTLICAIATPLQSDKGVSSFLARINKTKVAS